MRRQGIRRPSDMADRTPTIPPSGQSDRGVPEAVISWLIAMGRVSRRRYERFGSTNRAVVNAALRRACEDIALPV